MPKLNELFKQPLTIVNVGLSSMAHSVREQGAPVIDVDWQPPVDGAPRLRVTKTGVDIDAADEEVVKLIKAARPVLAGMGIARDVIAREKQIKAGSRQQKIGLIAGMNPEWRDLYDAL